MQIREDCVSRGFSLSLSPLSLSLSLSLDRDRSFSSRCKVSRTPTERCYIRVSPKKNQAADQPEMRSTMLWLRLRERLTNAEYFLK